MQNVGVVLSAVVAVFGVIGLGCLLRRLRWLTEESDASLLRVLVRLLFPCLIIRSIVGNEALNESYNIWLPPLIGFASVAVALLLSWLVAATLGPRIGLDTVARRRTFTTVVAIHNYGYVPIGLAEVLFGQGTPLLGVLFVTNVGAELAMWTLGVAVISGGQSRGGGMSRAFNAASVAVVAGLALHFARADAWVPTFLWTSVHMLGQCAVPLALLLIGATILDTLQASPGAPSEPNRVGMIVTACALRLGVLAAVLAAAAVLVGYWGGSVELQRVLFLHAAMPAAMFPIVLARVYGGDIRVAVRITIWTSLASLITTPLWLAWTLGSTR